MALLNYAAQVADLSKIKSNYTLNNLSQWDSNDQIKLILTGDKHIITHGVDLLADYNGSTRGLVPDYNPDLGNYAILGKSGWEVLTNNHLPTLNLEKIPTLTEEKIPSLSISKLPVAESVAAGNANNILTSAQIKEYVTNAISDGFAANDAMVFKGGVEKAEDLPSTYEAGYTYRAAKSFTLNEEVVEIGDLVIAKADYDKGGGWFVVQTNINGTVDVEINGVKYTIAANAGSDQNIYAPINPGSAEGDILVSTGGTPEWGKVTGTAVDGVISFVAKNGDRQLASFVTPEASGTWGIDISGNAATATNATNATNAINATKATEASYVTNSLKVGEGLLFGTNNTDSYNGSVERTINLKHATTDALGGIIVGEHLSIDNNGVLSVNTTNITGEIVTKLDNLNYEMSSTADDTQGVLNLKLIAKDSTTSDKGTIKFKGEQGVLVKSTDSDIKFRLDVAKTDTLGGIKIGYTTTTDREYDVKVDKDGHAYVVVPWTDNNNTWRKVTINNGEEVFDSTVSNANILNFVGDDNNITISKNDKNSIVISTKAEVNQNAFSNIKVGNATISAIAKTDTFELAGSNTIKLIPDSDNKIIAFEAIVNQATGLKVTDSGIELNKTGVTATSYGLSNDVTQTKGNSAEIIIPTFEVDDYGRLTKAGSYKFTAVDSVYNNGEGLSLNENNVFSLNVAQTNALGGIKLGFTETDSTPNKGKNYAVQLDTNNKAYVYVPWQNDNDNTWRDIYVGDQKLGNNQSLRFMPTGDIYVKAGDQVDGDDTYDVSFGLSWFNISNNAYEYVN